MTKLNRTVRKRKLSKKEDFNGVAAKANGSANNSVYCSGVSAHYNSPSHFNTNFNGNGSIGQENHYDTHNLQSKTSTIIQEEKEIADALYYSSGLINFSETELNMY